jgi:hypothetical protein
LLGEILPVNLTGPLRQWRVRVLVTHGLTSNAIEVPLKRTRRDSVLLNIRLTLTIHFFGSSSLARFLAFLSPPLALGGLHTHADQKDQWL